MVEKTLDQHIQSTYEDMCDLRREHFSLQCELVAEELVDRWNAAGHPCCPICGIGDDQSEHDI